MKIRAIGLMAGTSLDGVDAALVELAPDASGSISVRTIGAATLPLDGDLRDRLLRALPPNEPSPREIALIDVAVGEAFADAAQFVRNGERVDFAASHGVTLFHDGAAGLSLQIGNPYVLRDRLGLSVAYDFRRADCAQGGEGAPLVPFVDALLFGTEPTIALNLGGIANVALLDGDDIVGFDTGPGNILIDAFVRMKTSGTEQFDRAGAYAAHGSVDERVLAQMLSDPYFARKPPKSTGRERFSARFLAENGAFNLSLRDGCATLVELTARSIAQAIGGRMPDGTRAIVSGGGVDNPSLFEALKSSLPQYRFYRSDAFGVDAHFKEAITFAVLGCETLRGRAASLPAVTGAREAVVLGSIVPYELASLLERCAW